MDDRPNRRRIAKNASQEAVRAAESHRKEGWRRVFVVAGEVEVEYRDNQTHFHQTDHLGTPRVQTDSGGNAYVRRDPVNLADVGLNTFAATLGAFFADGSVSPDQLESWVRDIACQ